MDYTIDDLEARDSAHRLRALEALVDADVGGSRSASRSDSVAGAVATWASFGPYTPARALYHAAVEGLPLIGVVDNDTTIGAQEAVESGRMAGCQVVSGVSLRARDAGSEGEGETIRLLVHGLSPQGRQAFQELLTPARRGRIAAVTDEAEACLDRVGLAGIEPIDVARDVLPVSWHDRGGTVTEHHLLLVLGQRLIERYGRGSGLVATLSGELGLPLSDRDRRRLLEPSNRHLRFDLLELLHGLMRSTRGAVGALRADLPVQGAPELSDVIDLARKVGGVMLYAMPQRPGRLSSAGTVAGGADRDSSEGEAGAVTDRVRRLGLDGVAYDTSRLSATSLRRLVRACESAGLYEISASPVWTTRQLLAGADAVGPEFAGLARGLWALVTHARLVEGDVRRGVLHPEGPVGLRPLAERIEIYAGIAERSDPQDPTTIDRQVGIL